MSTTEKPATNSKTKLKRAARQYVLAYPTKFVIETEKGKVETSGFAVLDFPPTLPPSLYNNRSAIIKACQDAVYKENLAQYGNRTLVILNAADVFTVNYNTTTITKLVPPEEQVSSEKEEVSRLPKPGEAWLYRDGAVVVRVIEANDFEVKFRSSNGDEHATSLYSFLERYARSSNLPREERV